MTNRGAALLDDVGMSSAVLAATSLCPRIIKAAAHATHGPVDERLQRIREARDLCRDLSDRLEIAELRIAARKEGTVAALMRWVAAKGAQQ
jgi:hypothetical protein